MTLSKNDLILKITAVSGFTSTSTWCSLFGITVEGEKEKKETLLVANMWKHHNGKQQTSVKSRSDNKTNSRFTLQLALPSPPPPPLFPSLFSISLLFLPVLSASTACKAWNILKETSRGIDLRRRGELLQSNKHKLVSKAHHSPSRQTPLGWTRSDAQRQKRLPRQKRHQSLKIINERAACPQQSRRLNGSSDV